MKTFWTIVGIMLLCTAVLQAGVLIQDGFDDGGRTNGTDALDADWWRVYSYTLDVNASGGLGSGHALSVVGTGNSLFLANFPSQILDGDGDRMTLKFDFQILELANSTIRFGLLNANGTPVETDVDVDDLADDDGGYFFRLATGTGTDSKFYEDNGTSSPLGGGDLAARTSAVFGITDTNVHSVKMTYTYAEGTIEVAVTIDEGTPAEFNLSWTDSSSLKQDFSEAAIVFQGGMDGLVDNILVEYSEISNFAPEVNAGPDQVVFVGQSLQLAGAAVDPENQPMTFAWIATGPAAVTFDPDNTVLDPAVAFTAPGTYTLELRANDNVKTGSDVLAVIVRDPAEKALAAHWDFETLTPTDPNVFDAVSINNGTWTGIDPNYVAGWMPGASPDLAAAFFGEKYILINADPNAVPSLDDGLQYGMTVACWVKVEDTAAFDDVRILEKDSWALISSAANPGSVKFVLTGQPSNGVNAQAVVADGYWHHVAGTFDGKTMAVYVDGILDHSASAGGFLSANTNPVTIGADNAGGRRLVGAAVDDVRVYNYGLDAAEIEAIAALGRNRTPRVEAAISADSIQLPDDTLTLTLTASDPDMDVIDSLWTMASGPAAVSFGNDIAAQTEVTFNKEGRYVLRATVSDGMAVVFDEVNVLVYPVGWNGELAHMAYDTHPDDVTFWGYQAIVHGSPFYTTSAKIGSGAIEFNGTSDYLEYAPGLASDVTDLTFAAWVRADKAADMEVGGNFPNYDGEEQGWRLWFDDAGYFKLWMGERFNTYQAWNMTEATYTPGEWTHVALTFRYIEGDRNEVKFYVNGLLKLDSTTNYRVFPNPTIPFFVGRRPMADQQYLDGAIDDLWLYNRVLTLAEIGELAGLNVPPLVDAGPQKKILLPADSVVLDGSVTDTDPVTVAWSIMEGNAGVSFDPVDAAATKVTLPGLGDYLLRLTATDSFGKSVSDDVLVKVRPEGFDGLEAYINFENADPNLALHSAVGAGYQGIAYGDPNVGFAASETRLGAGGLELFGTDDYVAYSKFLGSDPALTASVWFNCQDIAAGGRILDKWPNNSTGLGWFIRIRNGDGNLAAMVGSGYNGPGLYQQAQAGTFAEGEWVHAVLTYEDGVMRLYQNGALLRQSNNVAFSPEDIVTPLNIGRRQNAPSEYFTGLIDEVRIYDYALSVEQVKAMYAADGGQPWQTCTSPALAGDLNKDCRVDLVDMAVLSEGWNASYSLATLSSLAQTWLDCDDRDLGNCF